MAAHDFQYHYQVKKIFESYDEHEEKRSKIPQNIQFWESKA